MAIFAIYHTITYNHRYRLSTKSIAYFFVRHIADTNIILHYNYIIQLCIQSEKFMSIQLCQFGVMCIATQGNRPISLCRTICRTSSDQFLKKITKQDFQYLQVYLPKFWGFQHIRFRSESLSDKMSDIRQSRTKCRIFFSLLL